MRFSVIIPAHNSANYITKGLESIRNQTFQDFELLVPCDSCTDNTQEIAESYGAKTCVVNYGQDGQTRNAGLDMAQGEYVLFMDDDDWWLHEFVLGQINKKLEDNHNPDLLCFSFIWKGIKYASPRSNGNTLYPSVWNKCWKRFYIGDTRFDDVYSISDYHFHLAMMKKPHTSIEWDMPMYYYNYLRPGSISHEMGRSYARTEEYWSKH